MRPAATVFAGRGRHSQTLQSEIASVHTGLEKRSRNRGANADRGSGRTERARTTLSERAKVASAFEGASVRRRPSVRSQSATGRRPDSQVHFVHFVRRSLAAAAN